MTETIRTTLKWVLCGSAFVAVIASTGCGGSSTPVAKKSYAPLVDPLQKTAPALAPKASDTALFDNPGAETEPAVAPVVNIFGEINGATPKPARQLGEAGFQQHSFLEEGYDANVAASPDGKWIVFASTRHSEHPDLYLQAVEGQSVTQLTADECDDAHPGFSPDGKKIAFSSTRNGTWDLYLMDIDGKNVTQITSGNTQDLHPSFSPNGQWIVYSSMGSKSGQWELWLLDLATSQKKMIGFGLFPSWSPDRGTDRIAFQRSRQRGSRWFSLWTLDLVDGEARRVTEVAVSSNAAIVAPVWSPDGKKIAFGTIVDPAKATPASPKGQQDVWTINADGTGKRRLTDGNGTNLSPFWAKDGRVFFISDRSGKECVWSAQTNDFAPGETVVKGVPKAKGESAIGATDGRTIAP